MKTRQGRVEVVPPREEMAPGRPYSAFSSERGFTGDQERDFLQGHVVIVQGGIDSN